MSKTYDINSASDRYPPYYSPEYFIETDEVDQDVKMIMEKYPIQD